MAKGKPVTALPRPRPKAVTAAAYFHDLNCPRLPGFFIYDGMAFT